MHSRARSLRRHLTPRPAYLFPLQLSPDCVWLGVNRSSPHPPPACPSRPRPPGALRLGARAPWPHRQPPRRPRVPRLHAGLPAQGPPALAGLPGAAPAAGGPLTSLPASTACAATPSPEPASRARVPARASRCARRLPALITLVSAARVVPGAKYASKGCTLSVSLRVASVRSHPRCVPPPSVPALLGRAGPEQGLLGGQEEDGHQRGDAVPHNGAALPRVHRDRAQRQGGHWGGWKGRREGGGKGWGWEAAGQ
jgi:hypothetical protein